MGEDLDEDQLEEVELDAAEEDAAIEDMLTPPKKVKELTVETVEKGKAPAVAKSGAKTAAIQNELKATQVISSILRAPIAAAHPPIAAGPALNNTTADTAKANPPSAAAKANTAAAAAKASCSWLQE